MAESLHGQGPLEFFVKRGVLETWIVVLKRTEAWEVVAFVFDGRVITTETLYTAVNEDGARIELKRQAQLAELRPEV